MKIAHATSGGRNMADLRVRFASAVVMAGLAVATLWHSGHAFVLFWLLAAVLVHWEWQNMVGGQRVWLRGLVGTAVLCAVAAWARQRDTDLPGLFLAIGALALAALAGKERWMWAGAGVIYAGALIIALCALRFSNPDFYRHLVIWWLFAIVWGTDVMAYFGGRLIGGPKLWRVISPSKTWSGTLVGIFSGSLLGLAVIFMWGPWVAPVPLWPMFWVGLALGAVAQMGDLLESAMKRHFGVKDSGNLIPGHGGFMDRLDGFVAASLVAATLGALRFGPWLAVNGVFQW